MSAILKMDAPAPTGQIWLGSVLIHVFMGHSSCVPNFMQGCITKCTIVPLKHPDYSFNLNPGCISSFRMNRCSNIYLLVYLHQMFQQLDSPIIPTFQKLSNIPYWYCLYIILFIFMGTISLLSNYFHLHAFSFITLTWLM